MNPCLGKQTSCDRSPLVHEKYRNYHESSELLLTLCANPGEKQPAHTQTAELSPTQYVPFFGLQPSSHTGYGLTLPRKHLDELSRVGPALPGCLRPGYGPGEQEDTGKLGNSQLLIFLEAQAVLTESHTTMLAKSGRLNTKGHCRTIHWKTENLYPLFF